MHRIALLQMTSGIDPLTNRDTIVRAIADAGEGGAAMLFTPEMCGLLDRKRERATPNIVPEADNPVLMSVQEAACEHKIAVALGSLAVERPDGKWANRSFVIGADGTIIARYDKMHMFDVDLETGESWRESIAYEAGDDVVAADTPIGLLGLSICYDIRFPALYDALGRLKCDVIAIPAAFTAPTGKAHWHIMQRARAIEASAFVISAAQVGKHEDGRETYGHSLVVDPWGEVLLDMGGEEAGLGFADIDLERIAQVRRQLPSLANRRPLGRASAK
ncbi:carbon-nitrogen hydrolase family protein [Altererythrobacter sp. ZODW24]|uniref:carbon-nitrogen hydrolase family protein n=1 Tax=Altererythrobacter sp. ZODW24 TaxID=2185142 RepID=UPI000DF7EAFB|nr:carbon-nitrogen hydrolase family protein [Altererythrobacter sp. ZODW24]